MGIHKTQCVHRMRLRLFVSQNEIDDIQVNRKDLYPDASALEAVDIFDENLPATADDTSDGEPEKKWLVSTTEKNTTIFRLLLASGCSQQDS